MKKILYLIILSLFFIPLTNVKALDSEDVDYDVTNYYIQADVDIAGALNVKELIVLDGDFNVYERKLKWQNTSIREFTGKEKDFYGSSIYNGTEVTKLKVGKINVGDNPKFDDLFSKAKYFDEAISPKNGDKNKYKILNKDASGEDIRMYNYTYSDVTAFYLEYTIPNISVKHKDVAELYYNFIGDEYVDNIENLEIRVFLPEADKNYKIWAHGPLNGTIYKTKDNTGAVLKTTDLPKYTPVDMRMTYNNDLFPICINKSKTSDMEALPTILKVETKRANDANHQREVARTLMFIAMVLGVLYIIGIIVLIIYFYIKYDKEYKSAFVGKYNRTIIDTYAPEDVEYLMDKKITGKALSASMLNLINKKNIKVEKATKGKNNYTFTLLNKDKISSSEEKLIDFLFNFIGDGKTFDSDEMRKKSKTTSSNKNLFYESYTEWKDEVETDSIAQDFYQDNNVYKFIGGVYVVFGIILVILNYIFKINSAWLYLSIPFMVIFIFYLASIKKRTVKGNEDYVKWKAYKNFLEDFGRLDEKKIPEVKLWEKLLVYAAVFGIADKVGKVMKTKFEEMHPNYDYATGNLFFPYYIGYAGFLNSFNDSVVGSISAAQMSQTQLSSGSGAGGGFSGGGGFGGGGGGGGGF